MDTNSNSMDKLTIVESSSINKSLPNILSKSKSTFQELLKQGISESKDEAYLSSKADNDEELEMVTLPAEEIANFRWNSICLMQKTAEQGIKDREKAEIASNEVTTLRSTLYSKDREVESLNRQLGFKEERISKLLQENAKLRSQMDILLRLGPTQRHVLYRPANPLTRPPPFPPELHPRPQTQHPKPPLLHKIDRQSTNQNQNQNQPKKTYSSAAIQRSYFQRHLRVSDSPPRLSPAVPRITRPSSAHGHPLALDLNNSADDEGSPKRPSSSSLYNSPQTRPIFRPNSQNGLFRSSSPSSNSSSTSSHLSKSSSKRNFIPAHLLPPSPASFSNEKNQNHRPHYTSHPFLTSPLFLEEGPDSPAEEKDYDKKVTKDKPKDKIEKRTPIPTPQQIKRGPLLPIPKSVLMINERENCMTTRLPYCINQMEDRMSEMLRAQEAEDSKIGGSMTGGGGQGGNNCLDGVDVHPVEVPGWRVKIYPPIEDPEDYPEIEDLSESVFLKRHQRLEIDEKRRKRWDSQRAREETYLERLKRRIESREKQKIKRRKAAAGRKLNGERGGGKGEGGGGESEEEIGSVHPTSDNILWIKVSEDIPIAIFGQPLPILERCVFELPWTPNPNDSTPLNSPPDTPESSSSSVSSLPSLPSPTTVPHLKRPSELLSPKRRLSPSSSPSNNPLSKASNTNHSSESKPINHLLIQQRQEEEVREEPQPSDDLDADADLDLDEFEDSKESSTEEDNNVNCLERVSPPTTATTNLNKDEDSSKSSSNQTESDGNENYKPPPL